MKSPSEDVTENNLIEREIDIKEIIYSLFQYKWSILFITLISFVIALYSIYFKTPLYLSNSLIEVKSGGKQSNSGDLLGSVFSNYGSANVAKDIELLKTFHINNHALNKVDFKVQYFANKRFKEIELYGDSAPITINNIRITDPQIIGRKISISLKENGYTLEVQNTLKVKLFHLLFNRPIVEMDSKIIYPFGSTISTKYFKLNIEKNANIITPLFFSLRGDNRSIYNSIQGRLQIQQKQVDSPLITVGVIDTIPARANVYADALVESFIHQSIAEKSKKNDRIIHFVEDQLAALKIKLDNAEKKLENYRIEHDAIEPTLKAQTYIKELSTTDIEISQNKLQAKLIDNMISYSNENKNLDAITPSLMQLGDKSTFNLVTKLQDAQIKEEGLKVQYSGKHPELIAVRKQIKYISKKIILNIKNLKISTLHRNNNLLKLKESYEKKLDDLPTQERILINLQRDYKVSSSTYEYLLKKKSENQMIKVAILSDYRIIDQAYSNNRPIGAKTPLILSLGLVIGFILGILQAILRDILNDRIHTKEDIEKITTIPIYGILPELKQKSLKLEIFKDSRSHFSESYRSLRTNLQFSRKNNIGNVILVTSTIMGEGKSTTASNLAAVFQMANYRTIIINLDMRKPTLHHFFDVDNTVGMSTYLSGSNTIHQILHHTQYHNLDIITSGPIPPNPSELILNEKLEILLSDLKEKYEYIIIDTAPLGLVTDTMNLMRYADISLIVFRANYAKKSFISDLNKLTIKHDLKHLGIVLNGTARPSSQHGYGYGYGYGYGTKENI